MKGLLGHNRKLTESKRVNRNVKRMIRRFPQFWPASVVHGAARWQDMPTDQFDWAMDQSLTRLEQQTGMKFR